jgi:hypothetical protein
VCDRKRRFAAHHSAHSLIQAPIEGGSNCKLGIKTIDSFQFLQHHPRTTRGSHASIKVSFGRHVPTQGLHAALFVVINGSVAIQYLILSPFPASLWVLCAAPRCVFQ